MSEKHQKKKPSFRTYHHITDSFNHLGVGFLDCSYNVHRDGRIQIEVSMTKVDWFKFKMKSVGVSEIIGSSAALLFLHHSIVTRAEKSVHVQAFFPPERVVLQFELQEQITRG